MRFVSLEVSGLDGALACERIDLARDKTLIQGANGRGKTRIATAMMDVFRSQYRPRRLLLEQALVLSFLSQRDDLGVSTRSAVLTGLIKQALAMRPGVFQGLLSVQLNRLMHRKLLSVSNKFGDPQRLGLPLEVAVATDGERSIRSRFGEDLNVRFQAAGEQFVMALAVNLAIRDTLGYHEPMVVDEALDGLDTGLLAPCFRTLIGRREQCIILGQDSLFDRVSERADVIIPIGMRTDPLSSGGA